MQIFDEILKQYMQLALKNGQNEVSLQKLNPNINFFSANNENSFGITKKIFATPSQNSENYSDYSENLEDIKGFYEKMEFDARRYNRNLDFQTGAFMI